MSSSSPVSHLARWGVRTLWVLFFLVLLVFTLVPLGVRWSVGYWFETQGVDAELEHFFIAPVAGRIEIAGFTAEKDGLVVARLDDLIVDVNVRALFDNHLEVSDFLISGLHLDVKKVDDDYHVAGLNLANLLASTQKDPSVMPEERLLEEVKQEPSSPLSVDLRNTAVTDLNVCAQASQKQVLMSHYCFSLADLSLTEQLSAVAGELLEVSVDGSVLINGLQLKDELKSLTVFQWQGLGIHQFDFLNDQLTLESVQLSGVSAFERLSSAPLGRVQSSHFAFEDFIISDIDVALSPVKASVGVVALEGANVLVYRDAQELLPIQRRIEATVKAVESLLPSSTDNSEQEETVKQQASAAGHADDPAGDGSAVVEPEIVLNQLALSKSRVAFLDEQIQPNVSQRIEDITITFGPFNSVDKNAVSQLNLEMGLNDFSSLKASGWVKPLSEKLNMEFDVSLEAFDALPISPYVERNLQYKVQKGHLNESLDIAILDDQLDIHSKLVLEKFYLDSLKDEELAKDEETSSLPVATAMNLLRDGDDRITLEIPVSGDVSAPDFSLRHILTGIIRKALTQAVINYYTPYGLVNIATALADSATQIRFEPLIYEAGETSLTREHHERLSKLTNILTDKPGLSLSFCPNVTEKDILKLLEVESVPEGGLVLTPEQLDQAKALGLDRAKSVKTALLEKKVASGQVILCLPDVQVNNKSLPEVSISI